MAKVKATGPKARWQALTGGKGYMGISLESQNHTGEALSAMVDWVNAHGRFDDVLVGLSDALNRHNYMRDKGLSLREAYDFAVRKGDSWLEVNRAILESLNRPYRIVRWSHWLDNYGEAVRECKSRFLEAYEGEPAFRASTDADIAAFLKRKGMSDDQAAIASCRNYLIEELAVYSVILKENPATVFYPGKQLNCFAYLREHKPPHLPKAIGETGFIRLAVHGLSKSEQTAPHRQVA